MGAALRRTKRATVLVLGLNSSGKTTVVNTLTKLTGHELAAFVSTFPISVHSVQLNSMYMTMVEISGKFRAVWEKLYRRCNGIIFVLDSSDPLRIAVAKEELLLTLSHEDLEHKPVPILFLANNMDNNEAIDCTFCTEALELSNIRDRRWQMYSVNALTGEGLTDAVDWFTSQLLDGWKDKLKPTDGSLPQELLKLFEGVDPDESDD